MERAPSFFDLCFAGCADAEFKIGRRIFSRANNRICGQRKKSAEIYLDWPSFSLKSKNGPAIRLMANLPGRVSLISLCRVSFRGLAVQSCGGMSNLLLPPGHVVG